MSITTQYLTVLSPSKDSTAWRTAILTISGTQKIRVAVVGTFDDLSNAASSAPYHARQKGIPYIGSGKKVVVVAGDRNCGFSPLIISPEAKIVQLKEEGSYQKLKPAVEKAQALAQKHALSFVSPLGHAKD